MLNVMFSTVANEISRSIFSDSFNPLKFDNVILNDSTSTVVLVVYEKKALSQVDGKRRKERKSAKFTFWLRSM